MFKLLQSIFGGERQGKYPELLIKMAIERAVDGTDPWLRAVSDYKKKLRPAVITTINHVIAMVDALPPPTPVHFGSYQVERCLKGFFISAKEMLDVFSSDRNLIEFIRQGGDPERIVALLGMEKLERGTFGSALTGEIVTHDVPLVTVSFEGHRLIDPTGNEQETRRLLKRRAFDHLLSLALKQLIYVKGERKELERHRELLQAKLNLLQREGWGFDPAATKGDIAQVEEKLAQIEEQMKEFGGNFGENEADLNIVVELLGNPEQYFLAKSDTIYMNQVGVKQSQAASDVHELSFTELYNAAGRRMVVLLVEINTVELRKVMTLS